MSCTSQIHRQGYGPNIPGSYEILLFTASDLASITSHTHNCVLLLLWLHLFILSGVVSPLISSSLLGTYRPREFIFQLSYLFGFSYCSCSSQGTLLKWFAIPFSSGPHFVELSTMTHRSWVALNGMAHSLIVRQGCVLFD